MVVKVEFALESGNVIPEAVMTSQKDNTLCALGLLEAGGLVKEPRALQYVRLYPEIRNVSGLFALLGDQLT